MDTAKPLSSSTAFWFPDRWIGGAALIAGPIMLLAGVLLRLDFHFFFPQQLAAYEAHPELSNKVVADAYGAFHIISILALPILCGWIVLAIGARLRAHWGCLDQSV